MEILQLLCSCCYCSANIPQLNCCYNSLTLRLAAISHQPFSLLLTGWLTADSCSKSKLLYDWQFTTNQFILVSSPLRLKPRIFFFNWTLCSNSPYVTSSLTRRWVVSYEYAWHFFKCKFHTYCMLLKSFPFALHTSPLSVQALQSRSCVSYLFYAITAA
jgi:hypothetical protein